MYLLLFLACDMNLNSSSPPLVNVEQPSTSLLPSESPTNQPSSGPSGAPSISGAPSTVPSIDPSLSPSLVPSLSSQPSRSGQPSTQPSSEPSLVPSISSQPTVSSHPSITPSKSMQPSITCDVSLKNILLGVSEKSALNDDTSPQGKALQWICNDSFSLSLIGNDDNRIIQRYALAVVYYSTDGDDWRNNNRWLVDGVVGNECGWYGVTCTLGIVTKLSMINNNLDGAIPVEIASLTELCKFLTFET